jgi:RES domain-containing protein
MIVYRIAKRKSRANDLSGMGAYNEGGRWNSQGTYALYTSESRSLAILEILVHVEPSELPPNLFIMTIAIDENAPIFDVQLHHLPMGWRVPENSALKIMGSNLFDDKKYLAIKAPSAVVPSEYNYILNPRFPGYYDLVKVISIEEYNVDNRLLP